MQGDVQIHVHRPGALDDLMNDMQTDAHLNRENMHAFMKLNVCRAACLV